MRHAKVRQVRRSVPSCQPALIVLLIALAVLSPAVLAGAGGEPPGATADGRPCSVPAADRQLLEQVLREGGVDTSTPRPRVSAYLGEVIWRALGGLFAWLPGFGTSGELAVLLAGGLAAAGVLSLLAVLSLRLLRRRRRVVTARSGAVVAVPEAAAGVDWQRELERRLVAGDAAGGLEALWWGLAVRLGAAEADPAWTTRELAERGGRRDLLPVVRSWDHLLYGARAVHTDQVRGLWRRLQRELG